MNRIFVLLGLLLLVSCEQEVKNYVTLKGKLKAEGIEKITLKGKNFSKEITVNKNGSFEDTLTVNVGVHALENGNDRITLFLKNGYDLELNFKGMNLSDGIDFEGLGEGTNNFMEKKRLFYASSFADPRTYFTLEKEAYDARISKAKSLLQQYKYEAKDLDTLIDKMDQRNNSMIISYIEKNYEKMHENATRLGKGKESPVFVDYENHKGGTSSLNDFKGSYVYIDVWATWCAPCKAEIPALKELETEFHGKNIEFISISVDKKEVHKTWQEMVTDENLGGVQLFANNSFESGFIIAYGINAIPRFILIDPEGNIVSSDAPRPSDPELKKLFGTLDI